MFLNHYFHYARCHDPRYSMFVLSGIKTEACSCSPDYPHVLHRGCLDKCALSFFVLQVSRLCAESVAAAGTPEFIPLDKYRASLTSLLPHSVSARSYRPTCLMTNAYPPASHRYLPASQMSVNYMSSGNAVHCTAILIDAVLYTRYPNASSPSLLLLRVLSSAHA